MTVAVIKRKILPVLQKEGVLKAAIFGSYARGDNKKRSDVDILVEMPKGSTLFDFGGLQYELEERLGKKVDLVMYAAIKPLIRDNILKDEKVIYER